jgi:hypothetical protein
MPTHRKLRIGLDFDGVVAYNPLRVVRGPITAVKRRFLKKKTTEFYIPKNPLMRFLFWIPHQFSVLPGPGLDDLKRLVDAGEAEAYIVSGRYGYLDADIPRWLKTHGFAGIFREVIANERDEQPHLFKERTLKRLNLDYFVEDNFDIVEHLSARLPTKILWIYNVVDRGSAYPRKFASLKAALASIGHAP